jgi:hypothetical protein
MHLCRLFKAAGLNILGRSAALEYSMSGTTESALYGNTSTLAAALRWRFDGRRNGGSRRRHRTYRARFRYCRIDTDSREFLRRCRAEASRGRISFGPMVDENGYALAQNFVRPERYAMRLPCSTASRFRSPGIRSSFQNPASRIGLATRAPSACVGWSTAHYGVATDRPLRPWRHAKVLMSGARRVGREPALRCRFHDEYG